MYSAHASATPTLCVWICALGFDALPKLEMEAVLVRQVLFPVAVKLSSFVSRRMVKVSPFGRTSAAPMLKVIVPLSPLVAGVVRARMAPLLSMTLVEWLR